MLKSKQEMTVVGYPYDQGFGQCGISCHKRVTYADGEVGSDHFSITMKDIMPPGLQTDGVYPFVIGKDHKSPDKRYSIKITVEAQEVEPSVELDENEDFPTEDLY